MPAPASDDLLAFIAGCFDEPDVQVLVERWRRLIRALGFDVSALGSWIGVGKDRRYRFYFNDWPQEWLDYYAEHRIFERDFIVAEARRRTRPFLWSELDEAVLSSSDARAVFDAARSHGWVDGFAIPIRGGKGYEGLVSLAAKQPIVLTSVERALLETAGREFIERCRATAELGHVPEGISQLTPREVECLNWVSLGKTDGEIAQLLGISKATAHFHVEQAKHKLGASTRVHAVALLVLYGVI